MTIKIFTDGASRGNPGPASFGFVVLHSSKVIHKEGQYIGETTNNVAEYTAVLKALEYVNEKLKKDEKLQVHLFADSKLVAEQLSGRYKIKAEHLKPIIQKIQLLNLELGGVIFSHIPREQNTIADQLANYALDNR